MQKQSYEPTIAMTEPASDMKTQAYTKREYLPLRKRGTKGDLRGLKKY
jgi:hypothetical protein